MRAWKVLSVGAIVVLAGCAGSSRTSGTTVVVSAAASLTGAFAAIESAFEADHPGVDIVLNLAGSSSLREQILQGAPADVFASADISNMTAVAEAGMVVGEPRVFARNLLQIAVPPDNPAGVTGLEDFADQDLLIGLCAVTVPCGEYARLALARAGVSAAVDTSEPDVRALLTKIEAGELDAGITYVSDVVSAGGSVEGIDIPDDVNVEADYPIAVLVDPSDPTAARAFVGFVLSAEGQAILTAQGFDSP